jgi:glucose-1-phosphate adenylyltransferase
VHVNDVPGFGIMKTNEENWITSFIEKPKSGFENWVSEVSPQMKAEGRLYLASMGIYLFNKNMLYDLLEGNDKTDFGKEIIPQSIANNKVLSYQYEGYWTDIGTIPSFFEANLGLTDDIPQFNLFDANPIYTRARMLPPSKMSGTHVDKAIIAEGCIINASHITRSIIGIRSRIGFGTVIENCYVMGNCHIRNAIIDKNSRIGDDVKINVGEKLENGDYETYTVQDGIVIVKKRAVIPNGTVI